LAFSILSTMSEEEPQIILEDKEKKEKKKDAPEQTKVSCCNYLCRMMGCCDIVKNGDGKPNLREGVLRSRVCTDIPWLMLCGIFFICCVSTIWMPAIDGANVDRFRGGSDYLLNICGYDATVQSRTYAAWPDLTQFDIKMCVADCAETNGISYYLGGYKSSPLVYWCVPDKDTIGYDVWFSYFEDYQFVHYMMDLYEHREIPAYAILFIFFFCLFFSYS